MFTLAKRQQLGNYIITFQVKEGDYAETYRVKDADGKNRFLKLINCAKLHRTQFDANGNILEVQIAKTLNHPNVVKYHDNGEVVSTVSHPSRISSTVTNVYPCAFNSSMILNAASTDDSDAS